MELSRKSTPLVMTQTLGLALILELVILYGAFLAITGYFRNTQQENPVTIDLVLNEEQKMEKPPEPPKPKVVPVVKTNVTQVVKTENLPVTNQPSENVVKEVVPTNVTARNETAQVAEPNVNKPDPMAVYRGQVNAAIQAATNCTSSAKEMNLKGKTRVQFNLMDTLQSGAKVINTSGIPMLDNIALNAVQNARYPKPPLEFVGQSKQMSVLVNLNCGD